MIDRWYRLAERYVVAMERTAEETARIAVAQHRGVVASEKNVAANEKNVAANERMSAVMDARIAIPPELPDLAAIAEAVVGLRDVLAKMAALAPSPDRKEQP